jgi:hypothetical protein
MRRLNRLLGGAPQAYWGRVAGPGGPARAAAAAPQAAAVAQLSVDQLLEAPLVTDTGELLRRQSEFVSFRVTQGVAEADAHVRRPASPALGWAGLG